jgi:hypothetical protein
MWLARVALATLLSAWTAAAHAHGEGALLAMVGLIIALLLVPLAIFLFVWRGTARQKLILLGMYLASIVASLALALALIPTVTSGFVLLALLVGIPLCVWAGLVLRWRSAP